MDALGTIQLYSSSCFYDDHIRRQKKYNAENPDKLNKKRDKTFRINPKWFRCFAGREEYA